MFEVDSLNCLTKTTHIEFTTTEETQLDRQGNREVHTNRSDEARNYGAVNDANEYTAISGTSSTYDGAGNIIIDEEGREYIYDERNRLREVQDSDDNTLTSYLYDALGRRISVTIGGVTTNYIYDGQNIIEERNNLDLRTRFHINGSQFVDERVATFDDSASELNHYQPNRNFTIADTGNADGTTIERTHNDSMGSFDGPPAGYFFDGDGDIDPPDLTDAASCQTAPNVPTAPGCEIHDFDRDNDVDLDDTDVSILCMSGDGNTPPNFCLISASYYHDADGDHDVDLEDFTEISFCQEHTPTDPRCLALFDFSVDVGSGVFNGNVDNADVGLFTICFGVSGTTGETGPNFTPDSCLRSTGPAGAAPQTGSFSLHGRPVDVLPDGKVLTYVRARNYDATNGRWLQSDPKGFADGGDLYEAFRSNASRFLDPLL